MREEALARHDELRVVVRAVLEAIRCVETDGDGSIVILRTAMVELSVAVQQMHDDAAISLNPALLMRDAWGEARVTELQDQRDLQASRVPLPSASVEELLEEARSLVRSVVRALRLEERTVLAEGRWSDDIVNLDPD